MINTTEYDDACWKLLSDNRESYFVQSARTRNGERVEYEHKPERTDERNAASN